ncbi:MAG: ankyrin repeat domain-containing protein [Candidatus Auribacterota bacterium]|nr:ankyrin repeat domain-containing protein [Candidatus Auribacterota bacterium]
MASIEITSKRVRIYGLAALLILIATSPLMAQIIAQDAHVEELFAAVFASDVSIVKILLQDGLSPEVRSLEAYESFLWYFGFAYRSEKKLLQTKAEQPGLTPLMVATAKSNRETVQVLITAGAEIDAQDEVFGWTPLMFGVEACNPESVEILLAHGARIDIRNTAGETALRCGVNHYPYTDQTKVCLKAILDILIGNGANVNDKNGVGRSVLSRAASRSVGSTEICRILIEAGANVNLRDDSGNTILNESLLSMEYNPDTVKLLIDHGADVNAKDKRSGYTPLMLCAIDGLVESASYLIAHGADVNEQSYCAKTALMIAVEKDNLHMVKLLLDSEANPNIKMENGPGALYFAKNDQIRDLLVEAGAKE